MTHPPTDPASGPAGSWDQRQHWEHVRRERRRVTVISVAIVAVAIVASVLIVALGTGGDGGDPAAATSDAVTPVATGPSGSPEEVVATYIEALREEDVDAAIEVTCGGLYQEAATAKEKGLGVSQDFSDLEAPAIKVEDPSFDTPAPAKLVWVDWKLGSDTTDRIFLTMVVNDAWKACEVGNESSPPSAGSTEANSPTGSSEDNSG